MQFWTTTQMMCAAGKSMIPIGDFICVCVCGSWANRFDTNSQSFFIPANGEHFGLWMLWKYILETSNMHLAWQKTAKSNATISCIIPRVCNVHQPAALYILVIGFHFFAPARVLFLSHSIKPLFFSFMLLATAISKIFVFRINLCSDAFYVRSCFTTINTIPCPRICSANFAPHKFINTPAVVTRSMCCFFCIFFFFFSYLCCSLKMECNR